MIPHKWVTRVGLFPEYDKIYFKPEYLTDPFTGRILGVDPVAVWCCMCDTGYSDDALQCVSKVNPPTVGAVS